LVSIIDGLWRDQLCHRARLCARTGIDAARLNALRREKQRRVFCRDDGDAIAADNRGADGTNALDTAAWNRGRHWAPRQRPDRFERLGPAGGPVSGAFCSVGLTRFSLFGDTEATVMVREHADKLAWT